MERGSLPDLGPGGQSRPRNRKLESGDGVKAMPGDGLSPCVVGHVITSKSSPRDLTCPMRMFWKLTVLEAFFV